LARKSAKPRGRIRITGGVWRSRQLSVLTMPDLRPSADRTRETLFNWLGQQLPGWRVLDLFAGTGVLGMEALSRGAKCADFVEKHPRIRAQLTENLASLTTDESCFNVIAQSAQRWLTETDTRYDLVLIDPPFRQPQLAGQMVEVLLERQLLTPQGFVYIESPQVMHDDWQGIRLYRQNQLGEAFCALYQKKPPHSTAE